MKRVWVVGEALIDLLRNENYEVPVVGGGPANTAKALANLGIQASLIAGISNDEFGKLIQKELAELDLSLSNKSSLRTALAIADVGHDGVAKYGFDLKGTATFDFDSIWLPSGNPEFLHIGSLAAVIEPGASELFVWAKDKNTQIIFDPNVRPSVIPNVSRYKTGVTRWLQISTVVKMSVEDFIWLGFKNPEEILSLGPKLLVITKGEQGIAGYFGDSEILVPGETIEVVDTIGAGDTVGAILIEGLLNFGLEVLIAERLKEVLGRANKAAAITCTRAGAKPPTLSELGA